MTAPSDRYLDHEDSYRVPGDADVFVYPDEHGKAGVEGCFSGTVRTPVGVAEVTAGRYWTWDGEANLPTPVQWVTFRAQIGRREYWRREERPSSAFLTPRGSGIVAHRWIRRLVDQVEEELAWHLFGPPPAGADVEAWRAEMEREHPGDVEACREAASAALRGLP